MEQFQSIEEFLEITSNLAFWVMTFQDVLRLNEIKVQDPYLRKLAKHHRIEDRGHEQWFLRDIGSAGNRKNCDIKELFDQKNSVTRDTSYAIMSEVFNFRR